MLTSNSAAKFEPQAKSRTRALQRRVLPAWLLSAVVHCGLLIILGFVFGPSIRTPGGDIDRPVGVSVVHTHQGERQYFTDREGDTDAANASAKTGASHAISTALPDVRELDIDLSGILPSDAGSAGEILGDNIDPGDIRGAATRDTSDIGGSVKTKVFGITGEGTRFLYVFDRSGSMAGFGGRPLRAAKRELIASLDDLGSTHQFQIIFYNERPRVFNPDGGTPQLVWGDEAGKQLARQFVAGITSDGGTRHIEALTMALRMTPDVIFFLTDADEPSIRPAELARIRRLNKRAAIHAIEFGYGKQSDANNFLVQLAEQNGGQHAYVNVANLQ